MKRHLIFIYSKPIAIDLKSYYASDECVERGLNPLQTNLVVADASRTDKTAYNNPELLGNPSLEFDYIIAPTQMGKYMKIGMQINKIDLKYLSPDDIHMYFIDEEFADITAQRNLK